MADSSDEMGTTTIIAPGAVARLGEALKTIDATALVLVTGAGSYTRSGARAAIEPQLDGFAVELVNGFSPNPTVEEVAAGLDAVERASVHGPPVIIGVGGGSAMDMAKLLAAAAAQEQPLGELLPAGATLAPTDATLILIPTTAGTGSEATHFATVYKGTQKYSVAHPSLRPRWALVDPDLCASLPPAITASTGVDALCQGIESLWAVGSTEASRAHASAAIARAMAHLEAAVLAPTPESRLGMCEAANWAGRAIDVSKTTACHALSYGLTIRWDVPHGHAVATSLGEMLVFNSKTSEVDVVDPRGIEHVREVMATVVRLLGGRDPEDAKRRFNDLMCRLDLVLNLSALGAGEADDRRWLASQVNVERLGNNPRRMGAPELDALLSRIAQ
jgi:alcohol dehydrogenase class IV